MCVAVMNIAPAGTTIEPRLLEELIGDLDAASVTLESDEAEERPDLFSAPVPPADSPKTVPARAVNPEVAPHASKPADAVPQPHVTRNADSRAPFFEPLPGAGKNPSSAPNHNKEGDDKGVAPIKKSFNYAPLGFFAGAAFSCVVLYNRVYNQWLQESENPLFTKSFEEYFLEEFLHNYDVKNPHFYFKSAAIICCLGGLFTTYKSLAG